MDVRRHVYQLLRKFKTDDPFRLADHADMSLYTIARLRGVPERFINLKCFKCHTLT